MPTLKMVFGFPIFDLKPVGLKSAAAYLVYSTQPIAQHFYFLNTSGLGMDNYISH